MPPIQDKPREGPTPITVLTCKGCQHYHSGDYEECKHPGLSRRVDGDLGADGTPTPEWCPVKGDQSDGESTALAKVRAAAGFGPHAGMGDVIAYIQMLVADMVTPKGLLDLLHDASELLENADHWPEADDMARRLHTMLAGLVAIRPKGEPELPGPVLDLLNDAAEMLDLAANTSTEGWPEADDMARRLRATVNGDQS